jgi:hypothetical protein
MAARFVFLISRFYGCSRSLIRAFFLRQYSKFLLVAIVLALTPGRRSAAQSLGNSGGDQGSGAAIAGRVEAWRYGLRFGIAVEGGGDPVSQ